MNSFVLQDQGYVVQRLEPGTSLTVGRGEASDWVLRDASISRVHARLSWSAQEPRPYVTDLGSSNGTFLDGVRLQPFEQGVLTAETRLRFGDWVFEVGRSPSGPALLEEDKSASTVVMFGDFKAGKHGTLKSWGEVGTLFEQLESERRSGQLSFRIGGATRELTLILGALKVEQRDGRALLGELYAASSVSYRYSPELSLDPPPGPTWFPSELLARLGVGR